MSDLQNLTIEECLNKQSHGYYSWIENGQLLGFVKEKALNPTTNQTSASSEVGD